MVEFNDRWVLFRPENKPSTALPFSVRSMGFYDVPAGWHDIRKKMNFTQVQWCIEGALFITSNGTEQRVPAGHAMYIRKGEKLLVRVEETSRYHWITFDNNTIESVLLSLGHTQEPWRCASLNPALFQKLAQEVARPTPLAQRLASATAYQILSQSCSYTNDTDSIISQALTIIHEEFHDPNLNATLLAKRLNLHRTRLSQLFHQSQGTTLIDYIVNYRLQAALSLLVTSTRSIADIATSVGYADANYFSRLVRKRTGHPPSALRGDWG